MVRRFPGGIVVGQNATQPLELTPLQQVQALITAAGGGGSSVSPTSVSGAVPSTGTTTPVVQHNLGTTDVGVWVREVATGLWTPVANRSIDANNVELTFTVAPTSGQYRYLITTGPAVSGNLPLGPIARARRNTGNITAAANTTYKVVELSASLLLGRMYRFRSTVGCWANAVTTIGDVFLRFTTDGNAPDATSPVFEHTSAICIAGGRVGQAVTDDFYTPTANVTARLLLTASIIGDAGGIYGATADAWPARITVEDVGTPVAVGGINF